MKRILSIFGLRKGKANEFELTIGDTSQAHRLKYAMDAAGLKHGDRAVVDVGPVQLAQRDLSKTQHAYFCNVRELNVKDIISKGDGTNLPMQVKFVGMRNKKLKASPAAQFFWLKNVELYSNGTIQVRATKSTVIETF